MKFADIPGHEREKETIRQMVDNDRIPQTLLLEGSSGAAKMMLARATAQYIHCTNRHNGDSCGTCPACQQHQAFANIDMVYSFPVVKRSGRPTISDDYIDVFRDFMQQYPYMPFDRWLSALDNINAQPQIYVEEAAQLLRRLTFMSRRAKYKVAIIWLPERFKTETANKLLKLVEEPYPDTKIIMVSDDPRAILPTIYSRCSRIPVVPYTIDEAAGILASQGIEPDQAHDAAIVAEGDVNRALEVASTPEIRTRQLQLFATLMRSAYARQVGALRQWSADVAALGREPAIALLEYCTRLLRESFIMHLSMPSLQTLNSAEHQFVNRFFPFITHRNVIELMELFDTACRDIAANANARIALFDMAIHTIILIRRK